MSFLPSGYGQDDVSKSITKNANPIVYHLTSNDPWRASIAISDAINLNNLGYNITVLLSIEDTSWCKKSSSFFEPE